MKKIIKPSKNSQRIEEIDNSLKANKDIRINHPSMKESTEAQDKILLEERKSLEVKS